MSMVLSFEVIGLSIITIIGYISAKIFDGENAAVCVCRRRYGLLSWIQVFYINSNGKILI